MRETVLGILGRQIHYSSTLSTDCTLYGLARAWTLSSDFKCGNSESTSSTITPSSTSSQLLTPIAPSSTSSSSTTQTETERASIKDHFEIQPEVVIKSKREELLQRRKTQGANKESTKATTLSNLRKELQNWGKDQRNRTSQYYTMKRNKYREIDDNLMEIEDNQEVPTLNLPSHIESSNPTTTSSDTIQSTSTASSVPSIPSSGPTTSNSNPSISVLS